jgi:hypothetical protein
MTDTGKYRRQAMMASQATQQDGRSDRRQRHRPRSSSDGRRRFGGWSPRRHMPARFPPLPPGTPPATRPILWRTQLPGSITCGANGETGPTVSDDAVGGPVADVGSAALVLWSSWTVGSVAGTPYWSVDLLSTQPCKLIADAGLHGSP